MFANALEGFNGELFHLANVVHSQLGVVELYGLFLRFFFGFSDAICKADRAFDIGVGYRLAVIGVECFVIVVNWLKWWFIFGDGFGAFEDFHEGVNMKAILEAVLIFVCEAFGYGDIVKFVESFEVASIGAS